MPVDATRNPYRAPTSPPQKESAWSKQSEGVKQAWIGAGAAVLATLLTAAFGFATGIVQAHPADGAAKDQTIEQLQRQIDELRSQAAALPVTQTPGGTGPASSSQPAPQAASKPGPQASPAADRPGPATLLSQMQTVEGHVRVEPVTIYAVEYQDAVVMEDSSWTCRPSAGWNIGRKFHTFEADIGLTDDLPSGSTAAIAVSLDGKDIPGGARTLALGPVKHVKVDVTGGNRLVLYTTSCSEAKLAFVNAKLF